MKKLVTLLSISLFCLSVLLNGCGGSGPSATPTPSPTANPTITVTPTPTPIVTPSPTPTPVVLFDDDFNYLPISPDPWTPVNGWGITAGPWAVVSNGFSGNGLQSLPGISGALLNSFSGSDYSISVKVNPASIVTDNSEIGIIGRISTDGGTFYTLTLVTSSSAGHPTYICMKKSWYVGSTNHYGGLYGGVAQFLTGPMSPGTFYDLKLTITGSSPVTLTGRVSDGSVSQTVTATDNGIDYGETIPSGRVGFMVYRYSEYCPIIDNFIVTTPTFD